MTVLIVMLAINSKVVVKENKEIASVESISFRLHLQMFPLGQLSYKQGQTASKQYGVTTRFGLLANNVCVSCP
jgi:hypothetical protein